MAGGLPGEGGNLGVGHGRGGFEALHMVSPCHRHNLAGGVSAGQGVLNDAAHIGLPHHRLRPVPLAARGQVAKLGAEFRRPQPVGVRVGGVLQRTLPEGLMAVLPRLGVQGGIGVEAGLSLLLVHGRAGRTQGQEYVGGEVHKAALRAVLVGPGDGLILGGVLGEGVENGAHRCRLGIGQNGDGGRGLRPGDVRELSAQIGGPLHQHQPGPDSVQQPPQMEGPGGGQMPHAEQDGQLHQAFSSLHSL